MSILLRHMRFLRSKFKNDEKILSDYCAEMENLEKALPQY